MATLFSHLARRRCLSALAVAALLGATTAEAAESSPATAPATKPSPGQDQGPWAVVLLEKVWPDHPEWAAMFVDILAGSQLGPGDGWFRKAVAQTRYTWPATCRRYDLDGDGMIARAEFPGDDADFARLDRDHDRALTDADFDFSANALAPSAGATLFYRADRDGNGKLTREELEEFFQRAVTDDSGFLSLAEMQEALGSRPMPRNIRPSAMAAAEGPSRFVLLRGLWRQEIGSLQAGPALGEPAPDFTLKTPDGEEEVTLSKLIGPKPVVLIFGNFTCGPFRSQAGNVEKLFRRYRDRAEFVMVYVREAHPEDGWHMDSNNRVGVSLRQPRSYGERVDVAQRCAARLGIPMTMLVDTLDDRVGARYSGMPSRLYLLDRKGRVAYKSGRGPFGFKPAELEHSLLLLLQDEAPAPDEPAPDHPEADVQAR